MVKIEVPRYCNDCDMFDPEVISRPMHAEGLMDGTITVGDTVIKCSNRNLCARLMKHLKETPLDKIN